jgi:hypothetical protein
MAAAVDADSKLGRREKSGRSACAGAGELEERRQPDACCAPAGARSMSEYGK